MHVKKLLQLSILIVLINSCHAQKGIVKNLEVNDLELFTFSPDAPTKMELSDNKFRIQELMCLEFEEFKYVYEYVSNEEFNKTEDQYDELQSKGNCKESVVQIASMHKIKDLSGYLIEFEFQISDTSLIINIFQFFKEHQYYYEFIPIGISMDSLNEDLSNMSKPLKNII